MKQDRPMGDAQRGLKMDKSWPLSPVPGYITFELPDVTAALEAFGKVEEEAESAGYHISTTWRGSAGEADIVVFASDSDRRAWNEAATARDHPRPVFALRWVWPSGSKP